jgi:uncharacterized protein (DUF1697 family)
VAEPTTFAALLRGLNVGGKNKLAMSDLRALIAAAGYEDVVTYIQSGNAVFRAPTADRSKAAKAIETAIADETGLAVSVLLRTHDELEATQEANPFVDHGAVPKHLHVVFLAAAPAADAISTLDPDRSPGDTFRVAGSEIFVDYGNGAGRSKLTPHYFERRLGTIGTARNWNTVLKLTELTRG